MNWTLFILLLNENSLFSAINPCFNVLALCEYFHMELLKSKDKTTKHNFSYWKIHFTLKWKFIFQCNKPYFNFLANLWILSHGGLTENEDKTTKHDFSYWKLQNFCIQYCYDIWYILICRDRQLTFKQKLAGRNF